MSISARLSRVEARIVPTDPFADLTDEELELAIVRLKETIEEQAGKPEVEIAAEFEQRLATRDAGDIDPDTMRAFIRSVKLTAEIERQMGRPLGRLQ